jgi:O-methyltransferase
MGIDRGVSGVICLFPRMLRGKRAVDNFYLTNYFDWRVKRISGLDRIVRALIKKSGLRVQFNSAYAVDELLSRITGKTYSPATSGTMTNVEQRMNLYHLVSQVLAFGVEGELVELGCNSGESSVLITKILQAQRSEKTLSIYDSFEGLPSLNSIDGKAYKKGGLATTEDVVRFNFARYNLPLPSIHKGWFSDTLPNGLPDKICFAYLDGDLYESILTSLVHVYPKMSPGAICLIDDYCDPEINPGGWNKLPGVKKACDEYLADKPESVEFIYSGTYSHGFFRKKA